MRSMNYKVQKYLTYPLRRETDKLNRLSEKEKKGIFQE